MIKKNSNSIYYLSLVSLVALSGCWGGRKEEVSFEIPAIAADDDSVVLLSVNGSPKITVNSLEADLNEIAEMDQQAKMMLMFDPEGIKEHMFKEQKRMAIVEEWAASTGARESEEYKNKKARFLSMIQKQLDFELFLKDHPVEVTDADVRDYYDKNKDQDYRIVVAQAGVDTQAVEFSSKSTADEFATEIKKAGIGNIEKLANSKDKKLFVRKLGKINDTSYADKEIKDAVLKLKKVPSIFVVASDDSNKYWVVAALSKEKAKYQEFDKVKDTLKQMLMPKKVTEMLEVKVPEYAAEFEVVENDTYFADLKKAKNEAMKKAQSDSIASDDLSSEK
jgi:hypothetical protein